jgi:hypothetical protein
VSFCCWTSSSLSPGSMFEATNFELLSFITNAVVIEHRKQNWRWKSHKTSYWIWWWNTMAADLALRCTCIPFTPLDAIAPRFRISFYV